MGLDHLPPSKFIFIIWISLHQRLSHFPIQFSLYSVVDRSEVSDPLTTAGHNCRFIKNTCRCIKNICCLSCTWLKSLLAATLLQHRLCIGKSFVSWHGSWSQQPSWKLQTQKYIHYPHCFKLTSSWVVNMAAGCLASTTAVILFHNISYFRWIINWEWWLWCWCWCWETAARVRFVKWKLSCKLKLAAEAKFLFIAGGLRVQRSGMLLPMGALRSSFINNLGIKC